MSLYLTAACNFKVGWPIRARRDAQTSSDGFTMVAPKQQFFCNGEVSMWRYQAGASNTFQAIVFRPVDGGHTQYTVVGINDIPAGEINTTVTYNVPEGDRIKVQCGDAIGWSFEQAVIPHDFMSDGDGSNLVRWIGGRHTYSADTITFNGGSGSRKYSIEATVSMNFKLFLVYLGIQ